MGRHAFWTLIKDAGAFRPAPGQVLHSALSKWGMHALLDFACSGQQSGGKGLDDLFESTGDYVALNAGDKAQKVFPAEQAEKKLPNFAESDLGYFRDHQRGSDPDQFVYQVRGSPDRGGPFILPRSPRRTTPPLDFSFDPSGPATASLSQQMAAAQTPEDRGPERRSHGRRLRE